MCREIEESMSSKADEVFLSMRRDYMTVITGVKPNQNENMPAWQRNMMADVSHTILSLESDDKEEDLEDEAAFPARENGIDDGSDSLRSGSSAPELDNADDEAHVKPETDRDELMADAVCD